MGNVLDIAIGVVFVFLVLSLLCTAINEAVATLVNKRGTNLLEGIKNLLNDPSLTGLAQQLYGHGLVDSLSRDAMNPKPSRPPSYIPAKTFAAALLDILAAQGVAAAAHGPLLVEAERARAAFEQARASSGSPAVLQQKQVEAEAAFAKLQQVAEKAAADLAALQNPAAAPPPDAAAIARAKGAADTASSAVKIFQARLAAVALAAAPKDAAAIDRASDALEEALALGRNLAATAPDRLRVIAAAIALLPSGHTKESLLVLVDQTRRTVPRLEDQFEHLVLRVESWFDDAMDRVRGWYKRWTQAVLLACAAVVVVSLNVDTLMLVDEISSSEAVRATLVAAAEKATAPEGAPGATFAQLSSLPLGWSFDAADRRHFPWKSGVRPEDPDRSWKLVGAWLLKLLGLLVSIGAVSLGAPFWFDSLSRIVNMRGAGTPPGQVGKSTSGGSRAAG